MWSNLSSAWESVSTTVGEVAASATAAVLEGAESAASEAGKLAQRSKLQAEIAYAQHSIDSLKREWGFEAFDAMVAGNAEKVQAKLYVAKTQIDELQSQIDEKNRQIEELEVEENPEDAVVMPSPAPATSTPAASTPAASRTEAPKPMPPPGADDRNAAAREQQALIEQSMAAAAPQATLAPPQDDDGFQDVGLTSPPEARQPMSPAPAAAADPLGAAATVEPDELDAALQEADEVLGAPPSDSAPVPGGSADGDAIDDEFKEIMAKGD